MQKVIFLQYSTLSPIKQLIIQTLPNISATFIVSAELQSISEPFAAAILAE